MKRVGVLLSSIGNYKPIAFLEIDPSGVVIAISCSKVIHPYALSKHSERLFETPLYSKYADLLARDKYLPYSVLVAESESLATRLNLEGETFGSIRVVARKAEIEVREDLDKDLAELPSLHENEPYYPLISIGEVPAVIKQLIRGKGDPRYAVLMFVPKDSKDGDHINLQFSVENGVVGLDWVLLGERNKKDGKKITTFAGRLGFALTPSEMNKVKYLRYEGPNLAVLGMRIVSEFYHFEPGAKVKLLVEGFRWRGDTPKRPQAVRSVVVCERDQDNIHSNWLDRVVVQRPAGGSFTVLAQKCTDPSLDRKPWETLETFKDIKSPLELIKALDQAGELLGVALEWPEVILEVASLDWVTSAVIAELKEGAIQVLPPLEKLRRQRSLKDLGKVEISVEWGYDSHDLELHFATWVRILHGESHSASRGYSYEGEQFMAEWFFDINREDQLAVGYDDGGTGWEGALDDVEYLQGPVIDGVDIAKAALKAAPINNDWLEARATWIMDGLSLYYRDTQLSLDQLKKYSVGEILRSPIFVDASPVERPLNTNCRYIIASSKAAPMFEFNSDVAKWRLYTLGCNSFFKILDLQQVGEQTQILLLHIPAEAAWYLRSNAVSTLSTRTDMTALKNQARMSFAQQKTLPPNPVFQDPEWLDRTSIPIGLEPDDSLCPMEPTKLVHPEAITLLGAIQKMTNDNSLNTMQESDS